MSEKQPAASRDPWPSFPSGSTAAWTLIVLAPPTTQPIKWSGWKP